MADIYQYPVFFELHGLPGTQKKTIERYFRVQRRSHGGECGPLRRATDTVYSIAFKYEQDQQAVLQKLKHVVKLEDGCVEFTVRGSLEPHTPTTSESPRQNSPAPEQSSETNPASTPPSSGERYELQLDAHLLSYLKECPKALKELEKELTSVSCSVHLLPEDSRATFTSLAQPAAGDGVRDWKTKVNKVINGYVCHYEVNPQKVKALLQSCRSSQTTDGLMVYRKDSTAVVVGKQSQVSDLLMGLVDGSRASETQTRIHQLGKAKLRLLWKEIELGLGQDFPGVKVTQTNVGEIVLEGSVEEIVKAGDMISNIENLVLERTVFDTSPYLLAFLRKAYGEPGMLGDFLEVGSKVEIELRDSDLSLYSLCADKLDDTENQLCQEFKEDDVDVPQCSVVATELWEKLQHTAMAMNQQQSRVLVVHEPDNKVCFVGHTKEVEDLREVVEQFILDQSWLQSTVPLPLTELAQELPELLLRNEFDCSGVTVHPLTSPLGSLIGPSAKVTEVRNRLGQYLDPIDQDGVITYDNGSVRYFWRSPQSDELIDAAPNLASLSWSDVNTTVAGYHLHGGLQVLVCHGDITKQEADALVSSANEDLDHCEGVAAALSKAGGPEVQSESNDLVKCLGRIPTGEVVLTTGGNLNCQKLLHVVRPVEGKAEGREKILLERAVHSALNLSEMMAFQSLAMPCIGSGAFGIPVTVCSEAIVTAVKEFSRQGGRSLRKIILIDNREEAVGAMQDACDSLLQGVTTGTSAPRDAGFPLDAAIEDKAGAPGDDVHVKIIQGTIETQQVDALVSPMVGHDPLSTCIGNILAETAGMHLIKKFRVEAGEETLHGDTVLVEDLPGLPFNAVFFVNLAPWDNDEDGTAIQVLRLCINQVLTSCDSRGFGSVAFPVLGAGIALRFPDSVVARVLLEEVHAFEQERVSRAPLSVRIVIHPNDEMATEAFKSVQEYSQHKEFTNKAKQQPDQESSVSDTKRIVLLGKTGSGKSNLANTIFGEKLFATNHSPNSGTRRCQAETKSVNGRSITLIDTPGFFDAGRTEEETKPEILSCITECAPGPHAFLIVLKVEKFTEHEQAVITKICQYFTEDALKYAVVVFTHGDQLHKGMKIEEFVRQNENLSDLVETCSGRCHVIDNKYWNNAVQNNYRSNQLQVEELLGTIDEMVTKNNGDFYVNQMFEAVEKEIQKEEEVIRERCVDMPGQEIRKEAKRVVSQKLLTQLAGTATGVLIGAFFGVAAMVGLCITALKNSTSAVRLMRRLPAFGGAAAVTAGGVEAAGLAAAGIVAGVLGVTGGVIGGVIGHNAAEGAETPREAAVRAANAVIDKGQASLNLHNWKL